MASTGNSGNGNTGTTGQSASSAQAAAAKGNSNASNAANGKGNGGSNSGTSTNTSGNTGSTNTSTGNTSTGATNSAGLMSSLTSFGNSITGNVGNTYGGSGSGNGSDNDSGNPNLSKGFLGAPNNVFRGFNTLVTEALISPENARGAVSPEAAAAGDKAYTKARAEGKTEKESQAIAKDTVARVNGKTAALGDYSTFASYAFKGKNTGPTYNPADTARATTNPTIAAGSSNSPAATTNNAPGNIGGKTGGIAGGTESGTESAAPSVSDATNTGVTNRGSTVTNGGGTSVTDSGTGGSISSSVTPPSRDSSSIGLGVYNTDRANYDQDNWNRGMEVESSSLVSDEECKAFAKRAFMENSEPFKKVRISIIKKC